MMQPQWQNGGFPQQGGWQGGYSPYGHELPEPEDTTPPHREGYERMSSRIFVTPAEASSADIVHELAESHGLVIQEKSITSLRPVDWPDEATFSAEINRIFKVKAGKSGAKFWKGVREAVMKQCTTHDLAPTCLAMHQSSYRYPLMPLHASTMTTGPSLWRDRSTVALRSPRVFFSTWPLAYPALRCRCSDGSSTTVTLIPFSRSADASSAAAVDLPLHGTPHMITRQPLAGVISVVSAHRRSRRSSTGSARRGRPIRRPPMCRAPAELAWEAIVQVGSSGKNASRRASQGTRAGRPPRTPWVG